MSVSKADIIDAAAKKQSSSCTQALLQDKENGVADVAIQQALKADLTYTVTFDTSAGLSASTQQATVQNIAGQLSGALTASRSNNITGKDLYLGVVVSPDFVQIKGEQVALGELQTPYIKTPNMWKKPCLGGTPCSPDGKWLAVENDLVLSASKPGRTLESPRVECEDGGSKRCNSSTKAIYNVSADKSKIVAIVYTYSTPVNLRLDAIEWGVP
jgi:hypothetical protein